MGKTFRRALVYGEGDVRIVELPMIVPKDDEVLIRVKEASVCPSDLRIFRGLVKAPPPDKPQHPGHEYAGIVEAVGKNVKRIKPGMRVVPQSWTPCFQCENCREFLYSHCENLQNNHGGFGEYAVVKESSVLEIPEGTSFGDASVTEPLASIFRADQERSKVTLGKKVVVIGLGPMGCMHVQVCHLLGAQVMGIDLIQSRCDIAKEMGADIVINASKTDPIEAVRHWTKWAPGPSGRGADVVIVTVGGSAQAAATEQALQMAGVYSIVNIYAGTYPEDLRITVEPNTIHYREIHLTGTRSYSPKYFKRALELINSGRVQVSKIRRPVLPFEEIDRAFRIHGTPEAMKVGLIMS
ncbi:MAG: alcohol dehydrogenase catalytic domain-containing protein [Chloroflexi bacterium]|nr:alcohol dehydrogenase catalytic domain-containing protein [Chloroflexota bacterium]